MEYFFMCSGEHGEAYSVDKAVVDFKLKFNNLDAVFAWIRRNPAMQYDHWTSWKIGCYNENFSIKCGDGSCSFWVGVGINTFGLRNGRAVRLEFNPNKVCKELEFKALWQVLRVSSAMPPRLRRWDLAIDYPFPREQCSLVKDARLYEEQRHSDADRTQYLGQRNASGRVKLYNKQAERRRAGESLPPTTRIEMTIDFEDTALAEKMYPTVYRTGGAWDVDTSIPDTDAFILRTLIDAPQRICELSRRKREKLLPLMQGCCRPLSFDNGAYMDVLYQFGQWLWKNGTIPESESEDEFAEVLGYEKGSFDDENGRELYEDAACVQSEIFDFISDCGHAESAAMGDGYCV